MEALRIGGLLLLLHCAFGAFISVPLNITARTTERVDISTSPNGDIYVLYDNTTGTVGYHKYTAQSSQWTTTVVGGFNNPPPNAIAIASTDSEVHVAFAIYNYLSYYYKFEFYSSVMVNLLSNAASQVSAVDLVVQSDGVANIIFVQMQSSLYCLCLVYTQGGVRVNSGTSSLFCSPYPIYSVGATVDKDDWIHAVLITTSGGKYMKFKPAVNPVVSVTNLPKLAIACVSVDPYMVAHVFGHSSSSGTYYSLIYPNQTVVPVLSVPTDVSNVDVPNIVVDKNNVIHVSYRTATGIVRVATSSNLVDWVYTDLPVNTFLGGMGIDFNDDVTYIVTFPALTLIQVINQQS
jgi:hypothetical protein